MMPRAWTITDTKKVEEHMLAVGYGWTSRVRRKVSDCSSNQLLHNVYVLASRCRNMHHHHEFACS